MILDLTAKSFVPGMKLYDRVIECLTERMQPVEMLAFFTKGDSTQTIEFPSSVLEFKKYSPSVSSDTWEDLMIPVVKAGATGDDEFLLEIHTWAGALHNNIQSYLNPKVARVNASNFATSFYPSIETEPGGGVTYSWKGLLTPNFVKKQLASIRRKIDDGELPWALLTVWGFEDTPFSWKECQHFYSFGGENDYTFLVLPAGDYVMYLTIAPDDEFS